MIDDAPTNVCADEDRGHGDANAKLLAEIDAQTRRHPSVPLMLGRYSLRTPIGRGGFGVVYSAIDTTLGRKVALKVLRARTRRLSDDAAESLIHEARVAAQIDHPNVVRVYDVGRTTPTSDDVFVVMELLRGESLKAWLRTDSRTPQQIVDVFLQAAEGLAAAHEMGVVHCDIKPGNVFVTRGGTAKVLDFGLSQYIVRPSMFTTETPTSSPEVAEAPLAGGTPRYMAPEAHDEQPLEASADQYSFGIALIEALAGSVPFSKGPKAALPVRKRRGLPRRWLAEHGVPRGLRTTLLRSIHPDPHQRFPTVAALAEALRRWRTPLPWTGAIAGIAVIGVAGLALSASLSPRQPCRPSPNAARDAWTESRNEIDTRWASVSELASTQTSFDNTAEAFVTAWTNTASEVCRLQERESYPDDAVEACLSERLGRLRAVLGAVAIADRETLERADRLAALLESPEPCLDPNAKTTPPIPSDPKTQLEVAQVRDELSLARVALRSGRYETGRNLARASLARALATDFGPLQSEALYETAMLDSALGDVELAAEHYEQAYFMAEGEKHDQLVVASAIRLTSLFADSFFEPARARAWARRADAALERIPDSEQWRAGLAYARAVLERQLLRPEEAAPLVEQALSIYEKLGSERSVTACLVLQGQIEQLQGNHERAAQIVERAYRRLREEAGEEHPDTLRALQNLATIQNDLNQFELARANYIQALAIVDRVLPNEHPTRVSILTNLGSLEMRLGRPEDAREHLRRALALAESAFPSRNPTVPIIAESLAIVSAQLGNHEDSLHQHRKALELRRELYEPPNPALGNSHANIALELAYLGRAQEMNAEFQHALDNIAAGSDRDAEIKARTQWALGKAIVGEQPVAELRRSIAELESRRPDWILATARFELARLIIDRDPEEALDLAHSSAGLYASFGMDEPAREVRTWIDAR